jgi:hypothetical protein
MAMAVAEGQSTREVAEACGVSHMTVARRKRNKAFAERVATIKREFSQQSLDFFLAIRKKHCRLIDAMGDPQKPIPDNPGARLRASIAVIELGMKLHLAGEFEDRLKAVEDRTANPEAKTFGERSA